MKFEIPLRHRLCKTAFAGTSGCWQEFDLYTNPKDRQNTACNLETAIGLQELKTSRRQGVLKVNVTRWTAKTFVLLIFLIGMTSSLHAQTKVALVDVGLVFKSHASFSAKLVELRTQADQFKAESQQLQQQLMRKAEGLNQYEKESDEYRDQEAMLAKESATLEVEQRGKMRDLLKQEAELHFSTYIEISNLISNYCDEYGVQLVLRFNSEQMNPKDPRTIMQQVNGGVVYYSNAADITKEVIRRVAQSRQASAPGNSNR